MAFFTAPLDGPALSSNNPCRSSTLRHLPGASSAPSTMFFGCCSFMTSVFGCGSVVEIGFERVKVNVVRRGRCPEMDRCERFGLDDLDQFFLEQLQHGQETHHHAELALFRREQ